MRGYGGVAVTGRQRDGSELLLVTTGNMEDVTEVTTLRLEAQTNTLIHDRQAEKTGETHLPSALPLLLLPPSSLAAGPHTIEVFAPFLL